MIEFTKMQSLGNDFVVIASLTSAFSLSTKQIRQLSDRHFGIGFDQLLVLEKSDKADFNYRIFNADGGEVEQCGNGVRCVAKYIIDHQLSDKMEIQLASKKGITQVVVDNDVYSVNLGSVTFSDERQLNYNNKPIVFTVVNIGNPHAVIIVEDVANADVAGIGAWLSIHHDFPDGLNVGFAQIVDNNHLNLRVYERGVGETLACGSGAAAAAAFAMRSNFVNKKIIVKQTGGALKIQWLGADTPVWLAGPATEVFVGRYLL